MKRIFRLILIFIFVAPSLIAAVQQDENILERLTTGKWVNRSDGYVPVPTYDPEEETDKAPRTVKRYKTFGFEKNMTFILDSAKQRYTGHYEITGNNVILRFNPANVTHLRKKNW